MTFNACFNGESLGFGTKLGFTALREGTINGAGSVAIDWFRFTK